MNEFWSTILFWTLSAAAVVLALAFVLPWLLRNSRVEQGKAARSDINLAVYRDQMNDLAAEFSSGQLTEEQYLASKLEIETRAAEDALSQEDRVGAPVASRRLAYVLILVLPVATLALYAWLGNPNALVASAGGGMPQMSAQSTEAEMLQIIQSIEERATANPNDLEMWETLANANAMMSRWPQALKAFERSRELAPNKAAVLSGYAEALAMTGDMLMAGRPLEFVNRALALDPNDRKGLELAAIHAFQSENFAESAQFLDRLLRLVTPDVPYAQEITRMRNEALRLAAGPQAAMANSVAGMVDIAPELRAQVGPQSVLYLIARDGERGPPVAAARVAMGEFPLQFQLDDSMAMNPSNTLSDRTEVVLLARISVSGNPIAQSGDLEGRVLGVPVGSQDVRVLIDRVVP
jgi:cytochrome c-type biogenesis protein CcmH